MIYFFVVVSSHLLQISFKPAHLDSHTKTQFFDKSFFIEADSFCWLFIDIMLGVIIILSRPLEAINISWDEIKLKF